MKPIILLACVALSYSNVAIAEITDETDYYNAICIADQTIGYNWENGDWKSGSYAPDKYIVQKLELEDQKAIENIGRTTKSYPCFYDRNWKSIPSEWGDEFIISGCYNVRKAGSEFYASVSQTCSETWKKDSETDTKSLKSVNCEHFKFRPNGWFHKSRIHNHTENKPEKDYKDSLLLTVGKCSTL